MSEYRTYDIYAERRVEFMEEVRVDEVLADGRHFVVGAEERELEVFRT